MDGCEAEQDTKGLCRTHYMRAWRHGDPSFVRHTVRIGSLAERLWAKVDRTESCWIWTGGTNIKGYGCIGLGERGRGKALAHRVSWELAFGPIPDGLWVLHHCDNPPCVRPDHLWLGTAADNNRDMVAKGRHWSQKFTGPPAPA